MYYLIGEKLGHSYSEKIHRTLGNDNYFLKEIGKTSFEDFILSKEYDGLNITIPYKKTVIPFLDYISPEAREIGAVNTVVNKNGILYGYNTDAFGLEELIIRAFGNNCFEDKKVAILGTGGTSNTALYVAKKMGADEIIKVSRTEKNNGTVLYSDTEKYRDADYLISTTPCGMYPDTDSSPVDLSLFDNLRGVIDVIYNPLRTRLMIQAEELGIKSAGGLYMLCSQAVYSDGLFFGKQADTSLCGKVYKSQLKDTENIVLIGMPSCGKTSVGIKIAEALGRKFIDTDRYICEKSGLEIKDIFQKYGEKHFRNLEKIAVFEIAKKERGAVIATGGGTVLDSENVIKLKSNGKLIFIDRDLDKLVFTSDRPLSSDKEKLSGLYNERYPIYKSICDISFNGNGNVTKVAGEIIKGLNDD